MKPRLMKRKKGLKVQMEQKLLHLVVGMILIMQKVKPLVVMIQQGEKILPILTKLKAKVIRQKSGGDSFALSLFPSNGCQFGTPLPFSLFEAWFFSESEDVEANKVI